MIHIERVHLPDGLRALACRDRRGNLVIYVSEGLDAKEQRAAIMEAVRATRRAGWGRTGLLPVGVALYLAIRPLLRALRVLVARPVAWGAAATATAVGASTAAIFIVAAPPPHRPAAAGQPPGPGSTAPAQPSGQPPAGRAPKHRGHPVTVASVPPGGGHSATSGRPHPAGSSGDASSGPAPGSSRSPAPPSPSPTPSPSPAKSPACVLVLGVKVCVPALSVWVRV